MSSFKERLDTLLTDENIEYVRSTGNVLDVKSIVRFGDVDFREKDFIGTNITRETIFNSIFNRDLNFHNDETLADKIRYALEIISGCAKIGMIPVSYIYDLPLWKQGGIAHLHMKDRGHTAFILTHLNHKATISVWRRVVDKLDENNCRGSDILINMKETIVSHIDNGIVKEFSISDVVSKQMIQKLNDTELMIETSLEGLENHKVEIININNSNNDWSTHKYGEIELQSLLAKDEEPALDIDELYNTVKHLDVFVSKRLFLSGTDNTTKKHASHEHEMLMFHLGCVLLQQKKSPKDKEMRYKAFEKTENVDARREMYRLIYEKGITTAQLKATARMWDTVGDNPRWDVFVNRIKTIIETIEKLGYLGSTNNLSDIIPKAPRAALRFIDMINDLKTELKWSSDIGSLTNVVINEALEMLNIPNSGDPMDNPIVKSLKENSTGRKSRETFFYSVLHNRIVEKYKTSKGARESKDRKLLKLRAYLTEHGFNKRTFDVIDRKRESVYTLTTVNLMNGSGFELGHKVAGAEFTDDNTFLQFPNDNRFNSAHDIDEGYWIEYGSWVSEMQKQNPDVDVDAFEDTLTFCSIMADNLI